VHRGTLIVIAGPSGVGKGTVVRRMVERDPVGLAISVSVTTRAPRPDEADGVHYRFITDAEFDRMIADGELLEWAEIVGHRSGTPRRVVEDLLAGGTDVILEIDVQGAAQVRDQMPDALLIFLAPPSLEELERRLRGRGTETEDSIRQRLDLAARELAQSSWFHATVVNDDVDRAMDQVAAIIQASRTT
jgi:guanylate kinase